VLSFIGQTSPWKYIQELVCLLVNFIWKILFLEFYYLHLKTIVVVKEYRKTKLGKKLFAETHSW